ncbi:MAG: rhomboid family intramembrane serine protease [Isosphaeraceae bacterium]
MRRATASQGWNLRRRPLTALSMVICIGIYFVGELSRTLEVQIWDRLGFFPLLALREPTNFGGALEAIRGGEYWRLITPSLLHVNLVHLIFNMWATSIESTAIEYTRGTRTLAVIILVSAVLSNIGQFVYGMEVEGELIRWGGYSGVLYALFGYIWMKSRFEPEHGMIISDSSVRVMLLWLLLGFTGIMPMANGAHLAGLLVGMLLGRVGI